MKNTPPTPEFKLPKQKSYRFNLRQLETEAFEALVNWKVDRESSDLRTKLFETIRELTYAILCVGSYESKYNIEAEHIAYEYALYLFERLVLGTFEPTYNDRFPFQKYIAINLKHVIITKNKDKNWHELIVDLEYLVNLEMSGVVEFNNPTETAHSKIDRYNLARELYKALRIFYKEDKINKLLPLSLEYLNSDAKFLSRNCPEDLKDFTITLSCLAKRLMKDQNINFIPHDFSMREYKKIVSSSVRSTVFLSAVVNSSFFPKEFLLSLDTDSLYRLVGTCGGQTIRVPTKKELDALIGTVVAVSKTIMEGKTIKESLHETKGDMDLLFPTRIKGTSIQSYISKIIEVHNIYGQDPNSDPIIHNIILAIKSIDKMLENIVKNAKDESPENLLKYYKEISSIFKILTDGMVKISTTALKHPLKEESANGQQQQ